MEIHFTANSSKSDPDRSINSDLAGQFIEHLFARTAHEESGPVESPTPADWEAIRDAVVGTDSLEQAVGRSIVAADLISRGRCATGEAGSSRSGGESGRVEHLRSALGKLTPRKGAPFLAISVVVLTLVVALAANLGGSSVRPHHPATAQSINGNSQLLIKAVPTALTSPTTTPASLPAATAPPAPAPPSLAAAPPLRPHEVFGFAPYWTLADSAGFDVSQLSTIAYFSIGVNADGTLDESGPGWNGYESQALANLVTRAHQAGDRVVLTVSDFSQTSLDQLTSSPTAPATLANALIGAIRAKNLDGVNLDLEGQGSADQHGLTNLVTKVSAAVHGVDPDYQVTMDTYASAAGDPGGFYNIPALAPAVDAFFVMAYQLNLQSGGSSTSPLTSTAFSEKTAVDQYTAAVPAAKVILGLPYFGIDWPTTDGTLTATATGPATTLSDGQEEASGHPIYWDATTDTAWTSYQVGTQWYETFFEVPASLYDAAQLATSNGLGGVGIWALGMDGDDASMSSALLGFSPAVKSYAAGPTSTSTSSSTTTSTSTSEPASTTTTSTSSTSTSTSTSTTEPDSTTSTSTTSTTDPDSTTSTSTTSTVPTPTTSTSSVTASTTTSTPSSGS